MVRLWLKKRIVANNNIASDGSQVVKCVMWIREMGVKWINLTPAHTPGAM